MLRERSGGEYYDAAVALGVDPLFLLAMFTHESSRGTSGTATQTRSWGNTRLPIIGKTQPKLTHDGKPVLVPGRSGFFPVWWSWLDGLKSTAERLVSTSYPEGKPYGLRTIGEIFTLVPAVWAPAGDLNNPAGYLRSVLDYMNLHQDIQEATVGNPLAKLTTSQEFIPSKLPNRPGRLLRGGSPNWITVHEVGNLNPQGGTARATRNYCHNGGGFNLAKGNLGVSFQAVVGDTESIQLLPWNETGYHAGDGSGDGNEDSIAIETQQVGNWQATLRNLAKLVAALMREFDLSIDRVVQHNKWSGKNCPEYLRSGIHPTTRQRSINWPTFIAMVQAEAAAFMKAPLVVEEGFVIPQVGETQVQIINGQAIVVSNYGPEERDVVAASVNTVDQGVLMRNKRDEEYNRSQFNNVMSGYTRVK